MQILRYARLPLFGILHINPKVVDTFLQETPEKWGYRSKKCQLVNEVGSPSFSRGKGEVKIFISSARLYVLPHNAKRFVVAIRYPDEKEPRYLIASDLS